MRDKLAVLSIFLLIILSFSGYAKSSSNNSSTALNMPLKITQPTNGALCNSQAKCPVVIVISNFGVSNSDYTFVSKAFNQRGYLSVVMANEFNGALWNYRDKMGLSVRYENWQRAVNTVKTVIEQLTILYPKYDFSELTLLGHSNGGDISVLFATIHPDKVHTVVTLANRRMLLPRNKKIRTLTLRTDDAELDNRLLLSNVELKHYPVKQITIANASKDDMHDGGPKWLVERISKEVELFLDYPF
ncbi:MULTISPECIES: alpha/beta hydrolase [unclassified Pseudoalteromonas]|jgi:pimeloyl-ACP methyl ester carboxylesterase|uniref:alpha/beta hydrolase n=1 Tax=unclassified Pseudoalteromonas TaxID=194690 RepID=UPI002573851B|nr:alpha/beta hydrolase [Pseudoalteromonas sp. MM1]BED88731.1 hypothetical protein PspMM1_11990 [Pseudoalteromonas sp. MM1]